MCECENIVELPSHGQLSKYAKERKGPVINVCSVKSTLQFVLHNQQQICEIKLMLWRKWQCFVFSKALSVRYTNCYMQIITLYLQQTFPVDLKNQATEVK